jgi:argininosuccinate synthase
MNAKHNGDINKVVLAYSGGLDTSVILKWLQTEYNCEVVTFTADLGQQEDLTAIKDKATKLGIHEVFVENLQQEFAQDFVYPMLRANAIYEGEYLLGTSIARPLIAKRLVEIAAETGADAISHGATGKGNDQVRFELNAYALNPNIHVIAPWREWDMKSRQDLIAFCEQHDIGVDYQKEANRAPYSMDANMVHISYEGGPLEDPNLAAPDDMWLWTNSIATAPDNPEIIELSYTSGDITAINGQPLTPDQVITQLNVIAGKHGIGRSDIVENRFVGMKSRGCYETPGVSVMHKAHRAIESITLDRELAHLKDDLMPRYATLIYNGFWFAPERQALQQLIDYSQRKVSGIVRLELFKGNISILGRESANSLFDANIASFEDDLGAYDQQDAAGFIKLNALRLKIANK